MIQGIGRVILFAKDMEAMSRFYRDVLGMVAEGPDPGSQEWRSFSTGGDCGFALHGIPAPYRAGVSIADPAEPRHAAASKLVLRVADAARALDELRARGVRFAGGAAPSPPLVRFDVLDPEGNIVQISEE